MVAAKAGFESLVSSGRCTAFIGSGPSTGFYASWHNLVNDLCEKCGVGDRVTNTSPPHEYLLAAEKARTADVAAYHALLGQHFGVLRGTNPLYDVLMRVRFQGYITPNFDPLLAYEARKPEHKCKVTHYPDLDRAAMRERTLFHIHGLIPEGQVPKPGEIVLSQSEFEEAYGTDSMLPGFLLGTFAKDPVCFIGCRLSEPPLARIFEICRKVQEKIRIGGGGTPPPKYILLPENRVEVRRPDGSLVRDAAAEAVRDAGDLVYYTSLGIDVVRYDPIDHAHTGLRRLFEPLTNLNPVPDLFGFGGSGTHV